jgi:Tfp pilus assembly protein PilX
MGSNGKENRSKKRARAHGKGFTLIASLLMLLLLSGIAIGLLMMVNTEGRAGVTDVQKNVAYHAAEGGIEKMASDLATTFASLQSPMASDICNLSGTSYQPAMPGINWSYYNVQPASGECGNTPLAGYTNSNGVSSEQWGQISSGPNQGLYAQIIPINMTATAQTLGGQEVSMTRSAQVALIPAFQFGVFCEGDCSFFSSPTLDFNGRVHTNGDLYLGVANNETLTFHDKLEAYGNVVTNNLPNTLPASSNNDNGTVYIPTKDGKCAFQGGASSTCVVLPAADGSVTANGGDPPQSSYNTAFNTFSGSVNHELIDGNYGNTTSGQVGTGAKLLSMPFITGTIHPYELIRRPTSLDTTALTQSRESNIAQIRILLSDDPQDFVGNGVSSSTSPAYLDPDNVRLANVTQPGATVESVVSQYGVNLLAANVGPAFTAGSYNLYFATASNGVPTDCNSSTPCSDWPYPPAPWSHTMAPNGVSPNPDPLLVTGVVGGLAAPYDWFVSPITTPTLSSGVVTNLPTSVILCPSQAQLGYPPLTAANGGPYPAACPASPPASTTGYYYYQTSPTTSVAAPANATTGAQTYQTATWNLIDGWLRVEYVDPSGTPHAVTNDWLSRGFARDVVPPTANSAGLPTTGTKNPINPNAILLLQEPADRATPGIGTLPPAYPASTSIVKNSTWNSTTNTWTAPTCTATIKIGATRYCSAWSGATAPPVLLDSTYWEFGLGGQTSGNPSVSQYNWYPINFYDAREGEPRDITNNQSNDTCTTNGVMNAVELDVGNLQQWLAQNYTKYSSAGTYVDYLAQNGYVLYFSDRRGMLLNPNPPMGGSAAKSGDSGLEDVINSGSTVGKPDGNLESPMAGLAVDGVALDSPEDVNLNGHLDNFGAWNLGLGFYGTVGNSAKNLNAQITNNSSTSTTPDPYGTGSSTSDTSNRIASCGATGRKNWVSGARHVLKLVDGALGNLPMSPVPQTVDGVTFYGGFTVASENPVYIQGDYNSSSSDTFFTGETNNTPGSDMTSPLHSPAAILADTVTILSNNWDDRNSTFLSPTQPQGNRSASTTYYRVAIAAGKTIRFTFPSWASSNDYYMGTDGGVHNFLHFLEDWQNTSFNPAQQTLHYGGSLVSLYFSTYDTGIFKCCSYSVYQPPFRDYMFDTDFTSPVGLPPGTPMFKDVETLGYRQLFTTRTN